jgi:DNA helicase HerA-like ATPase/energy-coupling factor transporter ATP-binding protein EcfA2
VTAGALVHLAVLNDALVVAELAATHDGVFSVEEKAYMAPLARTAVGYLARFRSFYQEFTHGIDDLKDFVDAHMHDTQPFGGKCTDTRWTGAQICRNFAVNAGDDGPLTQYRDAMVRLVDDIFALTKGSDPAWQKDLREQIALKSRLERSDTVDGRTAAFCAHSNTSFFHAVAHAQEVYERDPFDVEAIHNEARDIFVRTLQRVSAVNRQSKRGAMFLIRGESGSGKTHLMRAFRRYVHESNLGHVGYLQMTSASGSYARHVLTSLIDSLEKPFLSGESSSLTRIADSLMRWRVPAELGGRLREEPEAAARANIVGRIVDHLVAQPELAQIDIDLIRAFVYFASEDAVVEARVKRYLRCEQLSDYDRQHLGGITPPSDDGAPLRMLIGIGRLIAASHGGALVLLIDQLEDVYEADVAQARFRTLMDTLRQLTEQVPTSAAVIACLDDFYEGLRTSLTRSLLDRLEVDPPPVRIVAARSRDEVELLVGSRLRALLESQGARVRDDDPLWPFAPKEIAQLATLRTRDVLDWCREAHESCMAAGQIVPFGKRPTPTPDIVSVVVPLSAAWTKHFANFSLPAMEEDDLTKLLAWSFRQVAVETAGEIAATASDVVDVTFGSGPSAKRILLAICNAAPQGGALAKQVDAAAKRAGNVSARIVLVRCHDFPKSGAKTDIAKQMGLIVKNGGAKVVARDSDWRTLAALRVFVESHATSKELNAWLSTERIAARLELMKAMVGDDLPPPPRPVSIPPVAPVEPPGMATKPSGSSSPASPPSVPSIPVSTPRIATTEGPIRLGRTRSLHQADVSRDPATFVRHAAFLGSTGSGKTTLALNVIEQCLGRDVPVLLLDRKGDLCRYGIEGFWNEPEADADRAARKKALREKLRVQIFTPGAHRGRPLALPIVPSGLADLDLSERSNLAASAAAGLGSMMGYRTSQNDSARLAILAKAIQLLAELGGKKDIDLKDLIEFISSEDSILLDAIGKLDTRHFTALTNHLETLRLRHESLLHGGDTLASELLFGLGPFAAPGKTTLSVVSTKFLSDASVVDFWVSRLLIELTRWSSRNPSNRLQAIVMLDEADIYLPANSKPATKQPMQDLLRRARSAGVGVFLATQSPGDLDYRCRDNISSWFVGKIQENTALDKMRPLLSDYRSNPAAKLATADTGDFFVLADGNVIELKADRSLMKTDQLSEEQILAAAHG